jgi:hypothetical protein
MQTINATSIGNAACNLQITVGRLERIAEQLQLQPVLVLDHVRHYSDDQIELIRAEVVKRGQR